MSVHAGSNWWLFDFHNHTPASSDFDAITRQSLSPRDWLLAYMRASVDCVAVTDHNCGDWIDQLQRELVAMSSEQPQPVGFRPLHLFPGVEITAAEGLHILAIFAPADTVAKIHGLLALAKCNNHQSNAERICAEGAVAVCDHIHSSGGIVILAHAEEPNGIFEGNVDSTTGRYVPKRGAREINQILAKCDGIEVHDLNHAAIRHFSKEVNGRSLVDGSDAHHTARAGTRVVWLKMATPSIEGLRLALLDPLSSLTRDKGSTAAPARRITSLNIEQLLLRRQKLEVEFSPWFNSIIGGRGSGKSTLLEALRLALARETEIQELGEDSDVRRSFGRFRQVGGARGSAGMIRNETVVSASVEKHDKSTGGTERYRFTWTPTTFEATRHDDSGNWVATGLSEEQASSLFPVKIFSQKQVFELAERPSALLTYIDAAAEVDFKSWQEDNEKFRRRLRELRIEERALKQAIAKKPQLDTELKEATRKTIAYQQSTVAVQLKVFSENQKARRTVDAFVEAIAAPLRALDAVVGNSNPYAAVKLGDLSLQEPNPLPVRQASESLIEELSKQYDAVLTAIGMLRQQVAAFQNIPAVASFMSELESGMTAYREEVEKLRSAGVATAQEAEIALKRKQDLEVALSQVDAQEKQLTDIQAELRRAYVALKHHRRELTRRRRSFVDAVLSGNKKLQITIDEQSDVGQSAAEFRSLLRLQDGTFVDDVYSFDNSSVAPSGLLAKLVTDELHDPTHKRVTSLKIGLLERSQEILGHRLHGKLMTAIGRLTPDDEDVLLEWFPHDRVTVQFRRDESSSFQSLERASAGQKTSAILSFLLAHGDEPLLLDQPEDDLDNALISELVVEQIRANKSRRQIVVVTHNPNIVVNGDAELVLPMGFSNGQIQVNNSGGLQERKVRERICEVMEGGRQAFRQRYKRILEDLDVTP